MAADNELKLENTIVALIGYAGTGKYTIGRELSERTGAKLIDNHLINNPSLRSSTRMASRRFRPGSGTK